MFSLCALFRLTESERMVNMAKRNCRLGVRLTKNEYSEMTKKARKAGLTVGALIRLAVENQPIMEAPPADVPVLIREVRRVGSNIDQILKIANAKGLVEVPELRRALEENRKVEKMISDAYGSYGSNKDLGD